MVNMSLPTAARALSHSPEHPKPRETEQAINTGTHHYVCASELAKCLLVTLSPLLANHLIATWNIALFPGSDFHASLSSFTFTHPHRDCTNTHPATLNQHHLLSTTSTSLPAFAHFASLSTCLHTTNLRSSSIGKRQTTAKPASASTSASRAAGAREQHNASISARKPAMRACPSWRIAAACFLSFGSTPGTHVPHRPHAVCICPTLYFARGCAPALEPAQQPHRRDGGPGEP